MALESTPNPLYKQRNANFSKLVNAMLKTTDAEQFVSGLQDESTSFLSLAAESLSTADAVHEEDQKKASALIDLLKTLELQIQESRTRNAADADELSGGLYSTFQESLDGIQKAFTALQEMIDSGLTEAFGRHQHFSELRQLMHDHQGGLDRLAEIEGQLATIADTFSSLEENLKSEAQQKTKKLQEERENLLSTAELNNAQEKKSEYLALQEDDQVDQDRALIEKAIGLIKDLSGSINDILSALDDSGTRQEEAARSAYIATLKNHNDSTRILTEASLAQIGEGFEKGSVSQDEFDEALSLLQHPVVVNAGAISTGLEEIRSANQSSEGDSAENTLQENHHVKLVELNQILDKYGINIKSVQAEKEAEIRSRNPQALERQITREITSVVQHVRTEYQKILSLLDDDFSTLRDRFRDHISNGILFGVASSFHKSLGAQDYFEPLQKAVGLLDHHINAHPGLAREMLGYELDETPNDDHLGHFKSLLNDLKDELTRDSKLGVVLMASERVTRLYSPRVEHTPTLDQLNEQQRKLQSRVNALGNQCETIKHQREDIKETFRILLNSQNTCSSELQSAQEELKSSKETLQGYRLGLAQRFQELSLTASETGQGLEEAEIARQTFMEAAAKLNDLREDSDIPEVAAVATAQHRVEKLISSESYLQKTLRLVGDLLYKISDQEARFRTAFEREQEKFQIYGEDTDMSLKAFAEKRQQKVTTAKWEIKLNDEEGSFTGVFSLEDAIRFFTNASVEIVNQQESNQQDISSIGEVPEAEELIIPQKDSDEENPDVSMKKSQKENPVNKS